MVLLNDNDESREVIEACYRKRKTVLNPIINWTDDDVWEFIRENNLRYCELYDQGYKRLGCIGCPMNTKTADIDFNRYPKYRQNYIKAFDKLVQLRIADGLETRWKDGQDVMDWWLGKKKDKPVPGQISMFEEGE